MLLLTLTRAFVALFCLTSCLAQVINTGVIKIDLNAARDLGIWTVTGNNGTAEIKVAAGVPGGIYSDLEAENILGSQIYHDYNDMETRWVGRTDWTFSREFTASAELLEKSKVVLVCEGLDTIADVFVNDVLVGQSKNMFIRYIYDIKPALQLGTNKIIVAFKSPVLYAEAEYLKHEVEKGYDVLPPTVVPEFRGENKAQMIRKTQSSFSWDWGPSYASSGIWKNIYIEGLDGAVIRDVMIFNTPNQAIPDETDATEWTLTAQVFLDVSSADETGSLTFGLAGSQQKVRIPVQYSGKALDQPWNITVIVPGSNAKLWWPNGYGTANLHTYEVEYKSDNNEETSFRSLRVGFRTIELIQDLIDENKPEFGREFYFKVNGVKVYAKGSNSIPLHVLPEKITNEHTRWLLESAAQLHTNMIRIWGGGQYESDYFYDTADELGIMIWEDFIFACAMYPATPEFLTNVVEEIETQVKRLQYHASLVMWAANNENEGALRDNWYGIPEGDFDIYKADYVKLYVDTIIRNVSVLDPSRQCIASSPTNGIQTELEGWVSMNPGSSSYGDIHHYDYYSDSWEWSVFKRRTRFASEYGYQSFPYVGTLSRITEDLEAWTWHSDFTEHRQRHPKGQVEIRDLIKNHLPFPLDYNSPEAFPYMIYMAQIMQSMGQKTQSEFYRRLVDKLDPNDGTGHNMGALYWQLNDIWEGCSWATFEVNGRWKMVAYYAERFFAPILPSPYKNAEGDVVIELISDALEPFSGDMRVRVFKLESMIPLLDRTTSVSATFLTSKEVSRISVSDLELIGCTGAPTSPCLVYVTLPGAPDNFLFLQYPTDHNSVKFPQLESSDVVASPDGKTFTFNLSATEIAPFVFINLWESSNGRFSENGFIMVEGSKTLEYYSRDPMTVEEFTAQIHMMSLYDVTVMA